MNKKHSTTTSLIRDVKWMDASSQLGSNFLLSSQKGEMRRNPLIMICTTFQDAYLKASKMLGLGFAQRSRLKIEKAKTKRYDPTDPLELK